jgi:hypothetical protein
MMRWWVNYDDLVRSMHREFAEIRLSLFHMQTDARTHRNQIMSRIDESLAALSKSIAQVGTDIGDLGKIVRDNANGSDALNAVADKIDASVAALATVHQAAVAAEAIAAPPPTPAPAEAPAEPAAA